MKLLIATLLMLVAATPAAAGAAAAYGVTVCSAGRSGDHPAGIDEDGDAIPDSEDWCADSAPGTRVGPNGCADWEVPVDCVAATPVPSAPPVPEPAKAPVQDGDGDGVADAADKCQGTPAGLAVDASGCVQIEKVVLKGVNFASGSAELLPAASETLKTVASAMKASPKVEVEIGGHTDSVGPALRNQRLSERRAKSVKAFLVGEGVEDARLTTTGYGETEPSDSNETPEGRANNRRVVFKITAQ